MSRHALFEGPTAARRRLTLGAAAAALLLLTAACSADGAKSAACTAAATLDGWFGTTSAERENDCGPAAGQSARSYAGKPTRAEAPLADPATVSDLQLRLKTLGYDPGPADGQLGPKTRAAIRAYQRDTGLKADGMVTSSLLKRMQIERR